MSQLVEELKKEHQVLAEKLNDVRQKGLVSEEAKKTLFESKEALLAHLKKEDKEIYPVLKKAAETDDSIKRLLETFAKDMDIVSKTALDFFAKYENDPSNADFSTDIAKLLAALSNRITKEEYLLYQKYDEVTAK